MRWTRHLRRRARVSGEAAVHPEERAAEIRARLDRLAVERIELLADESVPGRKHRLDAVAGARADLEAELGALDPAALPGRRS